MDIVDDSAAKNFQEFHEKLRVGPWNTGVTGKKGQVVTEPLDTVDESAQDSVKRYTDRYLRHRTVGRTTDDFVFNPVFLPSELHKIVGLATSKPSKQKTTNRKGRLEERIADFGKEDGDPDKSLNDEDDNEEVDEEAEDEFEEVEDDDYNAEKYFDDGDDYGDGDDGDNEAAY